MTRDIPPSSHGKAVSQSSSTGVKELDDLLGGGLPKGSLVLLSGSSGSGKTTLAFQWLFEGIKSSENSVYITLTEPIFNTLKNLENMDYYDKRAIEKESLKLIDLRDMYKEGGFDQKEVIDKIESIVKESGVKRLCIDSITAVAYSIDKKADVRSFIFNLGKVLASLGCTTVLTSESPKEDEYSAYGVEEFISDVILRLDQIKNSGSLQRRLQIIKVRGRNYVSEDLFFRITYSGIRVFPKIDVLLDHTSSDERMSIGVKRLDDMLSGGILRGSTTLLSGASGTGKSLLSMYFIIDGLKRGECCLYASFEESRDQIVRNAKSYGWDIEKYEKDGLLFFRCTYPGSKHLDEHVSDIKDIVEKKKIKRCVIDSLSAIGNSFPKDPFLAFGKRLNAYLKSGLVTSILTSATGELVGGTMLSDSHLSTMTDNIIILRYIEIEGDLRKILNVVKVRGSAHSKGLRQYQITKDGISIGDSLSQYEGILTGSVRGTDRLTKRSLEDIKYALDQSSLVSMTDKDGVITYANDKFIEVSKYDKSELIGQNHRLLKSGFHKPEFFESMWNSISNGRIFKKDIRNEAKDGSIYWVRSVIMPRYNEERKVIGYVAVRSLITDIMSQIEDTYQNMKSGQEIGEDEKRHIDELMTGNYETYSWSTIFSGGKSTDGKV